MRLDWVLTSKPLHQPPGEKGLDHPFHGTLKSYLNMRLGRDAKIWRDEKLQKIQGNDVFSNKIVAQSTSLLLWFPS